MNIILKKKFIYYGKYKLRCSIGKRGITHNKKEGDRKSPRGIFKINSIFYIRDMFNIEQVFKKNNSVKLVIKN